LTSSAAVSRVRDAVNIVDVIQPYVRLRRSGAAFMGLCPFHKDNNASFSVSPEKGLFHCHGCQAAGDVFSFLQRIEGVTFPQALKQLSEQTGISLDATPRVLDRKQRLRTEQEALDSVWYWGYVRRRLVKLESQALWLESQALSRCTPESAPETAWLFFRFMEALWTANAHDLALIDRAAPAALWNAYRELPLSTRRAAHKDRLADEQDVAGVIQDLNTVLMAYAAKESAA